MGKKTVQMDFFCEADDINSEKIKKLQNSIKGLFKRIAILHKDVEFLSAELEDFISEAIYKDLE